jgi:deoxyribodipyrimidine photo-lyase
MTTVYLFHRDLRIADNKTFTEAVAYARQTNTKLLPIFIFTPAQVSKANTYKSDNSVQFMIDSLKDLKDQLNGHLYFFYGPTDEVLLQIHDANPIKAIFETADYTPFAKQRQLEVLSLATFIEADYNLIHDTYLTEPGTVLNKSGKPFQKFTPFWNTARTHKVPELYSKTPQPRLLSGSIFAPQPHTKSSLAEREISKFITKHNPHTLKGGRTEGLKLLADLPLKYDQEKDIPSKPTSYLSAHHHYGTIGIRETYHAARKANLEAMVRQLYWRDFYGHICHSFEELYGSSPYEFQREKMRAPYDEAALRRWQQGKTGEPMVDAAMTQLNTMGYIHNRGRLIVANYLVKTMKIFWRWGEDYFAKNLVDYDFAQNFGNWSWVASVLPYSQAPFRGMDPKRQEEIVDADGLYRKQWLNRQNLTTT